MTSRSRSRRPPDPFTRPLDRTLERLRELYPDAYRLLPGRPDRWRARCPLHPDAGFTLELVDYGERRWPLASCSVGCSARVLWRMLRPELEAQQHDRAAGGDRGAAVGGQVEAAQWLSRPSRCRRSRPTERIPGTRSWHGSTKRCGASRTGLSTSSASGSIADSRIRIDFEHGGFWRGQQRELLGTNGLRHALLLYDGHRLPAYNQADVLAIVSRIIVVATLEHS